MAVHNVHELIETALPTRAFVLDSARQVGSGGLASGERGFERGGPARNFSSSISTGVLVGKPRRHVLTHLA